MKIDNTVITDLTTSFKSSFQAGVDSKEQQHTKVATVIQSTTASNSYGWLGKMKGLREWIGPRIINSISTHSYSIKNKKYEDTVAVQADDIKDDVVGTYTPLFVEMGEGVSSHPDEVVFGLLKDGFNQDCYDGQPFFDTDHPTFIDGEETIYSNVQAGVGEPWYLLDTTRHIKPLIWQVREAPSMTIRDDPNNSDHVFNNDEYVYGVQCRSNAGFGLPQMAFASKADLTIANVKENRTKMTSQKNEVGRPLAIRPNLLVVGSLNEDAANDIVGQKMINGSNNMLYGKFEVLVVPWLD